MFVCYTMILCWIFFLLQFYISTKQFISVLCSLLVSYPTNTFRSTLKFSVFRVYNTHTHTHFFITSTSMTLHCSVNIYSISIFAFSSLQFHYFSMFLSIVSLCPLMILVSCYQECLTAANLSAILTLTMRTPNS